MMNQIGMRYSMRLLFVPALLFILGCDETQLNTETNNPTPPDVIGEVPPKDTTPPPASGQDPIADPIDNPIEKICSRLDFKDVSWPSTMTPQEQMQFAVALNITGSYEGNVGWKNLAGNFDGQGISMGLMQQNLGQGTLQPLWIEMFQRDPQALENLFSSGQRLSMRRMLEAWRGSPIPTIAELKREPAKLDIGELFPQGDSFNELDENYKPPFLRETIAKNDNSVAWARSEALSSNGQILGSWKSPLEVMAETSKYRSLQISASTLYFLKAQSYFQSFKFTEIRFLLLMYDFVVQNGSIGQAHLALYNMWLKNNPNASEEDRAFALLEARLTTVKDQYKADVRARKSTIIRGTGVVHKKNRNLPKEFCYDPSLKS